MKKCLAVFLALVLLIPAFVGTADAAAQGKYKVIAAAAGVFSAADIASEKLGEVYAGAVFDVTAVSHGFGKVTVKASGIVGWVQLSNMEYLGGEAVGEVTGLRVVPPEKTTFIHEAETLDLSGMKVYAVYDSGMQVTVTGYEVFCDAMDTLGEKEVRVTYTPKDSSVTFTDSFKVTVARYPVARLTLIKQPDRTMYLEHEKLDLTGLVLKITYADGRPEQMVSFEDVAADGHFVVTGCCGENQGEPLEKGTHTVTVYYRYEDIAASFPVSVTPRTLTSLTVVQPPDSLVTHHRDRAPSIAGLVLKAEYDNGEVEEVESYDCEVVCDPSGFILGENNPVEVRYGGKSVQLSYKLSLNNVTGILAVPTRTSFVLGQEIDPGLKVRLVYADGTFENVTDYEMTEIDTAKTGSQNIIVRYGEYSDVFTVSISAIYRPGDVNGDGKVEAEDARLVLRAAVGIIHFIKDAFNAADVDHDENITPADARLVLRAAVGLETL